MNGFSVRFYHFETVNFWSFQSFNQVYLEKFRSQVSQFAHNFRGEFFEGLKEFCQVHLDAKKVLLKLSNLIF